MYYTTTTTTTTKIVFNIYMRNVHIDRGIIIYNMYRKVYIVVIFNIIMGRNLSLDPMINTCVRISPEFHKLARENGIVLTEALRIGLSIMFAEKDLKEYDNKLNIVRKMNIFRSELEKINREFDEYRNKHEQHAERVEIKERKVETFEKGVNSL